MSVQLSLLNITLIASFDILLTIQAVSYPPKIQVEYSLPEVPTGSKQCEVKFNIHNDTIYGIYHIELICSDEN